MKLMLKMKLILEVHFRFIPYILFSLNCRYNKDNMRPNNFFRINYYLVICLTSNIIYNKYMLKL